MPFWHLFVWERLQKVAFDENCQNSNGHFSMGGGIHWCASINNSKQSDFRSYPKTSHVLTKQSQRLKFPHNSWLMTFPLTCSSWDKATADQEPWLTPAQSLSRHRDNKKVRGAKAPLPSSDRKYFTGHRNSPSPPRPPQVLLNTDIYMGFLENHMKMSAFDSLAPYKLNPSTF